LVESPTAARGDQRRSGGAGDQLQGVIAGNPLVAFRRPSCSASRSARFWRRSESAWPTLPRTRGRRL